MNCHLARLCGACWVLACLASAPAHAAVPSDDLLASLQRPTQAVIDRANLLSDAERQRLEARSRKLLDSHGASLVVVTLPSLQGGQIDDFANKLFTKWGIGDARQDKGVLLLVAMEDRKARIEVGYGLEPILPDALAGRILDDILLPAFRRQEYRAGLMNAAERIAVIVERNQPPKPEELTREEGLGERMIVAFFLSIFVGIGALVFGTGLGTRQVALLLFGGFFGGLPMLMGFAMGRPVAPILHPLVAIFAGWFGFNFSRVSSRTTSGRRRSRGGVGSTPWIWAIPSSGGSSSSSWSGGGFSSSSFGGFGGGSSGGGGASGGW